MSTSLEDLQEKEADADVSAAAQGGEFGARSGNAVDAAYLRAPSHMLTVFVVYYLPLFLVGLAGWVTRHYHISNSSGAEPQIQVNAVLIPV